MLLARRAFLLAAAAVPFAAVATPRRDGLRQADRRIAEIDGKTGGRLGVYVRDSGLVHGHSGERTAAFRDRHGHSS